MSKIDWKSFSNDGGKGGKQKNKYVKFTDGSSVNFRPFGEGVQFYKFFVNTPQGARSVCVDEADKNEVAAKIAAKTGKDVKPNERYAINVIDRADNSVKILEGGKSIFKSFYVWAEGNKAHPSHAEKGGDWMVTAEGAGMTRKYSAMYIRPSPLTQEEMQLEKYKLEDIYKSTPLKDVMNVLFGGPGNSGAAGPEDDEEELVTASKGKSVNEEDVNW